MAKPRVKMPAQDGAFGREEYGYGLTMKSNFLNHKVIGHGGSVGVATANISWITEKNIGIAILTNGSGYPTRDFALYGLATLLGEDPEELPPLKHIRQLEALEGNYESYKATIRMQVKRAGDLLLLIQTDKLATISTPLIPYALDQDRCVFYIADNLSRLYVEFRLKGTVVDLIYERYLLRRVGRLS
jgi:hypothetical protein